MNSIQSILSRRVLSWLRLVRLDHLFTAQRRQDRLHELPLQLPFLVLVSVSLVRTSPLQWELTLLRFQPKRHKHPFAHNMSLHRTCAQTRASSHFFGVSNVWPGAFADLLQLAQAMLLELSGLARHCGLFKHLLDIWRRLPGLLLCERLKALEWAFE